MEFIIGGLAGMGAGIFTNPMDVAKTRMQLQGELVEKGKHKVHYRGTAHALYVIATKEGLLALQKGLVPALWFQLLMNSVRLGCFNWAENKSWNKNKHGELSLWRSAMVAAASGSLGVVVSSPIYLAKTQIQAASHESIAVGDQHSHKGTWDALRNIYKSGGVRGLFQGVSAGVPRAFVGSAAQLTSFSWSKEILATYKVCDTTSLTFTFLASGISGGVTTLVMCPFDVVSTRLFNQKQEAGTHKYCGWLDCLIKTYKIEGLRGLYKGTLPLYFRLAPHTTLSLMFWDELKYLLER